MILRLSLLPFGSILLLLFFVSCSNNNSEGVSIDCSRSDLTLTVARTIKSDCNVPGTIELAPLGGKSPYQYSADGESFQASPIFDELFAGSFSFFVQDDNGCLASVETILESEPGGISMTLESTISDCLDDTGTITATATGGSGVFSYSLDNGPFTPSDAFSNVSSGNHTVTVKDAEGCEITKDILVPTNVSLENDIMPIILSNCAISNCHNGTRSPNLSSKSNVIVESSRIKAETQSGSMPRNRTLPQDDIDRIACWVDDGAKDN